MAGDLWVYTHTHTHTQAAMSTQIKTMLHHRATLYQTASS